MSSGPNTLDLNSLPPEARALIQAQQAQIAALSSDNSALAVSNKRLGDLVKELRHALRGKKSEKLTEDERQFAFEDLSIAVAEVEEAQEEASATPIASRKKRSPVNRNLGNLPEDLPRIEEVIEPDSTLCPCGCGEMRRIGEDRTERLDIIPAQLQVVVTIRPKYACKACEDGVIQALAPAHLIRGALPTEGAIAHVLVSKYSDHLPLYRQSQILARSGIDLHRSVLADWVGKASAHLAPLVDLLAADLKTSTKLFMDETTAPVLDPGRGRTKTGFLWALARDDRGWGGVDPPGVVYFYAPGRGGEHAEKFLTGFNGTLQIDGYQGYNRLAKPTRKGGDPVQFAYCWAHARRKLREIFDRDKSEIAAEGLKRIAQFYKIEAEIRGAGPGQRLSARQTRTAPLVKDFGAWLKEQRARVSAKSRLGEKLTYIANHWDGLQTFLKDGRVEIDSNNIENRMRPIALNRKNALFAGHDEGGASWGRIASLIETAKMNGVEPFAYIKATLKILAKRDPETDLKTLLPWNFQTA